MRTTSMTLQLQAACWLILLCIAASLSPVSFAAEVKPISIEVVGEPNSSVPIAPSAPPTPVPEDTFAKALDPVWSDMRLAQQSSARYSPPLGEVLTDILVPVLAVSLIFGGPILLIIVLATMRYRARARREKMHAENIARLIEAGRDVPLEMLQGSVGGKKEDNLRNGIKNVGVGSGLLIFLTLFLGIKIGSVGFIIIGYGLSQLAVWKFVDSKAAPQSIGIERD